MKYNEIILEIPIEYLGVTEAICSMVVPYGFHIEDYSDVEDLLSIMPRELIDDALFEQDRSKAKVHLYLSEEIHPEESVLYLKDRFAIEKIPFAITMDQVDEEDYANAWKRYYKPLRVGKNIMIVPSWESYDQKETDIILELDPGMAFGTGTHETTRLCMEYLEELVEKDDQILDVGCGSGILAITAIKLGAKKAVGSDIDPVAVKVAKENAELNGVVSNTEWVCSDLTAGVSGKFNIVCANIVADIILQLLKILPNFLQENGHCILSGIIDIRSEEVRKALIENGYKIVSQKEEAGWVALCVTK